MPLLDMTTPPEVRAALGVNDIELPDATLNLDLYSSNLLMELDDLSLQLRSKYDEVKVIAAEARTPEQQRLYASARLFATYAVAKQCCISLPMFGPKSVSDNKAEVSRFSDSPYKETVKAVTAQFEVQRGRVAQALAAVNSTSVSRVPLNVMLVSSPSSDPVTG